VTGKRKREQTTRAEIRQIRKMLERLERKIRKSTERKRIGFDSSEIVASGEVVPMMDDGDE
jgi:hypothetical protein